MPALPLDEAGRYVAAAYVVFVALLLIYLAIMAIRLERVRRELTDLAELAERRETTDAVEQPHEERATSNEERAGDEQVPTTSEVS